MAYHSLNNHIPSLGGGNYAACISLTKVFELAASSKSLSKVNLRNAGNTKFDERNIIAAYIRNGGIANKAAAMVGYSNGAPNNAGHGGKSGSASRAFKKRFLGANIDTVYRTNRWMKSRGLATEMRPMHGGHYPFFYVVERLLQIKYPGYDAVTPGHLNGWFPPEDSIYYKWFREVTD